MNENGFTYQLIRSNRRTIAIHVLKDGSIEVRAPLKTPISYIEKFIGKKETWIKEKVALTIEQFHAATAFTLDFEAKLSLLGAAYPLSAVDDNRAGFDGNVFYLPRHLPEQERKPLMINIYKQLSKEIMTNKVAYYANLMKVQPTGVKINSAKTRWGSCSGKNSINFSWMLIMADEASVDYVVVHELSHIKEHNHSPLFWAEVAKIMPDYKKREEGLKKLQQKIIRENWA